MTSLDVAQMIGIVILIVLNIQQNRRQNKLRKQLNDRLDEIFNLVRSRPIIPKNSTHKANLEIESQLLNKLEAIATEVRLLKTGYEKLPSSRFLANPGLVESSKSEPANFSILPLEDDSPKDDILPTAASWLTDRGITIRSYRLPAAEDKILDEIAMFLGDRFETLSKFYNRLKRNLSDGNSFSLNLSGKDPREINDITSFGNRLDRYALVPCKYSKETKVIRVTPLRDGRVNNFLTGDWFERFIYLKSSALFSQLKLDYSYLANSRVILPNDNDFEIDIFFLIDHQPLWIECKTGDYNRHVLKYSAIRRILSIPKQRSLLVILGLSDELTNELTDLHDITVANQSTFLDKIRDALGLSETESSSDSLQASTNQISNLSAFLNKSGLRPLPEYRMQVITTLIDIIDAQAQPTSLADVKEILADRLALPKSPIQDILAALVRSQCLLDENGELALSFRIPVSDLISSDPQAVEKKCVESYASAILRVDPNYFDNPQNVSEFEQVVGAKPPELEKIEELRRN
jgi:hypothetical protein